MRLPENYACLKPGLGDFLAQRRKAQGRRQKEVAYELGINRVNLSRMEKGHLTPSYETLSRMMDVLRFEWKHVAVEGPSPHGNRRYLSGQLDRMGKALRAGREKEGRKLRDLANTVGLSYSQLSRIERGLISYSRVISVRFVGKRPSPDEVDPDKDQTWRIFEFAHPELVRLAALGGYEELR
ncbi:helix-turn-helix transcriptional regulator [Citromicrobium bathyomarinum]|uniref:helix-turn-helix domain-containing protein n=1 Tax=Citromicrobium bathyomarinum TaxID=72174 RepID=UPI00315AB11B